MVGAPGGSAPRKIVAVGHRGTAIGVPENSLISHETAYAMGARGIEFDIRPTLNQEFVIFHDAAVDRMTNGTGKVDEMTIDELKALRLVHGGAETPHQIPTLREALRNVGGRFMVDIDFKGGFDGAAKTLLDVLREEGFDKPSAPLVTIFCRSEETTEELLALNELYAVRPVYINKNQAGRMAGLGIKVMGLRNHKFTKSRAQRIRGELKMKLFTNTMTYNIWGLLREVLGLPMKPRKKPSDKKLRGYYQEAMSEGSLFIQTDYLPDLVAFLKANDAYEDGVLSRDFKPLPPPGDDGPLIA